MKRIQKEPQTAIRGDRGGAGGAPRHVPRNTRRLIMHQETRRSEADGAGGSRQATHTQGTHSPFCSTTERRSSTRTRQERPKSLSTFQLHSTEKTSVGVGSRKPVRLVHMTPNNSRERIYSRDGSNCRWQQIHKQISRGKKVHTPSQRARGENEWRHGCLPGRSRHNSDRTRRHHSDCLRPLSSPVSTFSFFHGLFDHLRYQEEEWLGQGAQ